MNKMGQGVKSARLTADGTSTAVAIKIQIKPFRKERNPINQMTAIREKIYQTCFQRNWARPKVPQLPWRRRSKPTSMMRSKTMSVMAIEMSVGLLLGALGRPQESIGGTHTARSYGGD
jgi:hypothetical protein